MKDDLMWNINKNLILNAPRTEHKKSPTKSEAELKHINRVTKNHHAQLKLSAFTLPKMV